MLCGDAWSSICRLIVVKYAVTANNDWIFSVVHIESTVENFDRNTLEFSQKKKRKNIGIINVTEKAW